MKKVLAVLLAVMLMAAFAGGALAAPTVNSNYPGFTWGEADLDSVTLNNTPVVPSYKWTWHTSDDVRNDILSADHYANVATALGNDDIYAWWGVFPSGDVSGTAFVLTVSPDVVDALKDYTLAARIIGTNSGDIVFNATAPTVTFGTNTISFTASSNCAFADDPTGYTKEHFIFLVAGGGTPGIPVITTASPLPDGTVGKPYTLQLEASNSQYVTDWDILSGDVLPDGLSLDKEKGIISGTPSKAGTFEFTLKVHYSAGGSPKVFKLTIKESGTNPIVKKEYKEQVNPTISSDIADMPVSVKPGNEALVDELATGGLSVISGLDNPEQVAVHTSFFVTVSHDEAASGDIELKVTLDPGITPVEGSKLYVMVEEKSGDKYTAFPAEYDAATKVLTFTVTDYTKYFSDGAAIVASVKEKAAPSGSSSGCSAGFAALALLAFVPVVIRRKK